MKNFIIFTKNYEPNRELIDSLISAIEVKNGKAKLIDQTNMSENEKIEIPEDVDCVLTVGGDGTLIDAAQRVYGKGIPLLGINRGHLGYLCDLDDDIVFTALDQLFTDAFEVEERMMISGTLVDEDGNTLSKAYALNDIVISSCGGLNLIDLTVYVNGKYLYSYPCDGMIFSTPTGSTAYNLSAHGPIVNPKTNVILLTPINPHTLNSRSIILDKDDEITVEITRRHIELSENAEIAFDGGHKVILEPGKKVIVHRTHAKTNMIRLKDLNFLERIRTKLQAI